VIVRAIGPELTQYGITNPLADPTLQLHNGAGTLIASNDNWQTKIIGGIIARDQVSDIQNSGLAPAAASESAIIANQHRVITPRLCRVGTTPDIVYCVA
jgi:hypothetical protein